MDAFMRQFFLMILRWPKCVILVCLVVIGLSASQLPKLKKDASANAYIPPNHSALLYREKVKETFGLDDPLVIAIINEKDGIFNPVTLKLIQWFSDALMDVPNVDPDKIKSLSTLKNVKGLSYGLDVTPLLPDDFSFSDEAINTLKTDIEQLPLYEGALVSKDHKGVIFVIELLDTEKAPETYLALEALKAKARLTNEQVYISGEGAIRGYLQEYMSQDARKMIPLAVLFILVLLFFTFRTPRSVAIPALIMLSTLLTTVGIMAGANVAFFVITNALPVILIGIAVADSMHIFGEYYKQMAEYPDTEKHDLIVNSMMQMWRPITLTTLTSVAGFGGIYIAEQMPPMAYFGLFSALGIAAALMFSFAFIPALLMLLPKKPTKVALHARPNQSLLLERLGLTIFKHSQGILVISVVLLAAGLYSAMQLSVDEERITSFRADEPLPLADRAINQTFNGSNTIDIVVQTAKEEGLYQASALKKIADLQDYIASLDGVGGTLSIVDYLKTIHQAMNQGDARFYQLPVDDELIAQYFLLYDASGEPGDFEAYVDYGYQTANIRVSLKTGRYSNNKPVILAIEDYITQHVDSDNLTASVSGRVAVDYHWIELLADGHFKSLTLALLLVLVVTIVLFKSLTAGVIALLPVVFAVLMIYAVMGLFDIWLGIGTSMFAAIAIGLGVDFSIHTLERFIQLVKNQGLTMQQAMVAFFPSTGRVLLFNFLAVGLGFGLLILSHVIPLVRFGALVTISIAVSFIASVTLIPAILRVFNPRFIRQAKSSSSTHSSSTQLSIGLTLGLYLGLGTIVLCLSNATMAKDAQAIMQAVNAIDDGKQLSQKMTIKMTDKRGKTRIRETRLLRKYFGDDKKLRIVYDSPKSVRGTGFLIIDYADNAKEDDQWLYLPAMKKIRRIASSDRGKSFLGTDFSFDDMKNGSKVALDDFTFTHVGSETIDGLRLEKIECLPISKKKAKELGYSKVVRWVDTKRHLVIQSKHWDVAGNPLKIIHSTDFKAIDGIWTAQKVIAQNSKNKHSTVLVLTDISYATPLPDEAFSKRKLANAR